MQIGLELSSGNKKLLWRQLDQQLLTIGRNLSCDLCIPDEAVAPLHATLQQCGSSVYFINRHAHGTQIGDELVTARYKLAHGDQIHLGKLRATVCFKSATMPAAPEDVEEEHTRILPRQTRHSNNADSTVATTPPLLVCLPDKGQSWQLNGESGRDQTGLTIGSDASNAIVLKDPYVSRIHARLQMQNGRCMVTDLGSRNGVFVAEQKINEGEVPLGVQLRLGESVLLVHAYTHNQNKHNLQQSHYSQQNKSNNAPCLLGSSPIMRQLRQLLRRIAVHDAPVLIMGETGTGKEVVAEILTALSQRTAGPLRTLNCGALGSELIASELFGHERGAFAGAAARKIGAFEAAHGGTLFLDEIGELPLELQPHLLRVLESGVVQRVGSNKNFQVDVRLIAATNRCLQHETAAGNFREDLFHRLHVLVIELPPLRERASDIHELAEHFLACVTPNGAEPISLSAAAQLKLMQHNWPGNVRELRNVIQRATLMRTQPMIEPDDITFAYSGNISTMSTHNYPYNSDTFQGRTMQDIERNAIIEELLRSRGNKSEVADALGVSRSTIHRRICDYQIDVDELLARRGSRRT